MLGRLARWLRILGYDTLYYRRIDDLLLVRTARSQRRWLLTRDAILLRERRPEKAFFIREDRVDQQLQQMIAQFGTPPQEAWLCRCLECNEMLAPLSRQDAQPLVPAYVHETQDRFARCPACRRIYWQGTHYERIRSRLQRLLPKSR